MDFPAEQHLLHVAARHHPHRHVYRSRLDVQPVHQFLRQGAGRFFVDERPLVAPIGFEEHIVHHPHRRDQAHSQPVLRHEAHADAEVDDLGGGLSDDVFLFVEDGALAGLHQPRDGLAQLLLAASSHAGHAQDFPGADVKADVVETAGAVLPIHRQIDHLEQDLLIRHLRTADLQGDGLAHHQLGQPLFIGFGCRDRLHAFPFAQDGHPVADGHHLAQLVGDDDDRAALLLHPAKDLEQLVRLLGGQYGGRLVEDQDLRPPVQHLEDLHRLLFAHRHVVYLFVRVDFQAEGGAEFPDLLPQEGRLAVALPDAQHDVVHRAEHLHQLEMLMDHADPQLHGVTRGVDDHLMPADGDAARVGMVNPRQHVHKRGFSRSVFPQQGQDFPVPHR